MWDLFCLASVAGIWPRFIEPRLILTTPVRLKVPNLPSDLDGFKILQFSDLHINSRSSSSFLKRLIKKAKELQPDLIVFTGDFLCYSKLSDPERLTSFLRQFHAPYGCYAILGNHDYASCVSINSKGEYDEIEPPKGSSLRRGFARLGKSITLTKTSTDKAKSIPLHSELIQHLAKTPFKLLHNQTVNLTVGETKLNLTGLGEYMLGRVDAEAAFRNYDRNAPGIVLLHNPDGIPLLNDCPGDVILSGHTHGGQINLPWMWKKFTLLENMEFKKGLLNVGRKWVYINRGVGSVLPFRWFSPPEFTLITLE